MILAPSWWADGMQYQIQNLPFEMNLTKLNQEVLRTLNASQNVLSNDKVPFCAGSI